MKKRTITHIVFILLLAISVGISFIQVPPNAARLLYLLSLGMAVFALIVSFALILVIDPLRERLQLIRIALASVLVLIGPFTLRIWTSFEWWMPFWVVFSGLLLLEPRGWKKNLPNLVFTIAALALSFFPTYAWIATLVVAVNGALYLIVPFASKNRAFAFFISSYSAIYSITALPNLSGALLGLLIPMLVLAIGCLEPRIVHLRRNRIENDSIRQSELTIAHIEEKALKAEIRPHFLLNALNNVRVAYHEDSDEGRKLLDELIGLETMIAEASKQDYIPIMQEIEIIRGLIKLFSLERKRDINFVIDVKDKDLMIPPMLLEPLVENSLQHSGIMNQDDGEVLIQEYEDFGFAIINVADNGQGQPLPSQSRGIGLSNVIKRIELLDQGHMNITSDDQGTSIEIRFRLEQEELL